MDVQAVVFGTTHSPSVHIDGSSAACLASGVVSSVIEMWALQLVTLLGAFASSVVGSIANIICFSPPHMLCGRRTSATTASTGTLQLVTLRGAFAFSVVGPIADTIFFSPPHMLCGRRTPGPVIPAKQTRCTGSEAYPQVNARPTAPSSCMGRVVGKYVEETGKR